MKSRIVLIETIGKTDRTGGVYPGPCAYVAQWIASCLPQGSGRNEFMRRIDAMGHPINALTDQSTADIRRMPRREAWGVKWEDF